MFSSEFCAGLFDLCAATCKMNGNFQRFSTADLYQFTSGTPLERFLFILQVAVGHLYMYVSLSFWGSVCVCMCLPG
jgi:hypothetical protein